jgi:hypothetical protein
MCDSDSISLCRLLLLLLYVHQYNAHFLLWAICAETDDFLTHKFQDYFDLYVVSYAPCTRELEGEEGEKEEGTWVSEQYMCMYVVY